MHRQMERAAARPVFCSVFASVLQTLAAFCGPGFLGPIQPAMAACKNR